MEITALKKSILEHTEGLLYSSESDFPLQLLDWGQITPAEVEQTISALCNGGTAIAVNGDDFFNRYIQRLQRSSDATLNADAARFKKLQEFLADNTDSVMVWKCGTISIDIFIVLITTGGNVLALKTTAIET